MAPGRERVISGKCDMRGLLGIKYEVAVRSDVVGAVSEDIEAEGNVT
jgi:hypothetical protein